MPYKVSKNEFLTAKANSELAKGVLKVAPEYKMKNSFTAKRHLFVFLITALFITAVVSVCIGKYPIGIGDIYNILCGNSSDTMTTKVLYTLRLPRTLMAIISGIALGTAGSIYQIIFKNPLASPDIIGVAGGANLGAAVSIVLFSSSGIVVATGAFWGGLAAVFAVLLLVKCTESHSTSTYVLAGIVINAISKAFIMALKYFADYENELAAMEYWEMGTFGNITLNKLLSVFPMFIFGLIGLILLRRQIEIMNLSDTEAKALGVQLSLIRITVLVLSTLMVGAVISVTGLVAFSGLIAPHISRLILKKNNSETMLLSGLVGALVVLCADILARLLYSTELPISILTTVTGVPFLIYFLCKKGRNSL